MVFMPSAAAPLEVLEICGPIGVFQLDLLERESNITLAHA
jgi:hypothetical protein